MIDEMKYGLKNLWNRKLRSSLTILSILIGITAIFALVSFGWGIQSYMNTIAEEAGVDKIFLLPKSVGAPGMDENFFITEEDVNFVSKIKGIKEISAMYFRVGEIEFNKEKKYGFVGGIDPEKKDLLEESFTVTVGKGRFLKKGEMNKVVLGYNYQIPDKIFKRGVKLGDKIEVNGNKYAVVGFYEEIGNPQDDSNMYMTLEAMEALYEGLEGKYNYVMIKAEKGVNPGVLAEKIEDKLRKFKGQDEGKEDFYAQTFEDALETFANVLTIINGVLVLIALISLFVASVNIMNTMYTSTLERTQEIGVMKAIGARNKNILFIFVFEAGMLGMLGGLMGVGLGWLVSSAGGAAAAAAGYTSLQPVFPWPLTAGCILFATVVGAGAGFLPALQASKLKPVDALRYE